MAGCKERITSDGLREQTESCDMRQASHGRDKIWLVVQAVLLNACPHSLGYARKGSESNILFRSPAALQGRLRVPGDPSRAHVVSPPKCISYDGDIRSSDT